ncbi:transcriptional regulator, AlpA family [Roseovarius lutimaris]|uniref:Transcriptional regulator, AlpA family n=1 Tax=Roseovarius lutimaris TaxID=1005928 RepID=A0A1I5G3P0_9RHOB|nr:transcriptional regulator, AlpA family [Roseovarius lutimaris]
MAETYLSDHHLSARYNVHRSTPWRWTNTDPTFPKPVKLSPQCSRWKLSEIEAWETRRAASAKYPPHRSDRGGLARLRFGHLHSELSTARCFR